MGMKLASKFNGTSVANSQSRQHLEGWYEESQLLHYQVCKGLHAAAVPPPTVVQTSCPHNTCFQTSAHVAGLRLAVLVRYVVLCLLRITWGEQEEEEERLYLSTRSTR
eukprot:1144803-Pelagomonas_calceolata.AAC.5